MNFEENWKNKSLEYLEKDIWPSLTNDEGSYLIQTCHRLRKKQLKDFEVEDLRIMIGQNMGLNYLIPLAIKKLELNILAEGDFYEGDLLKNVLTSDTEYWKSEKTNWVKVRELYINNVSVINESDTSEKIKKGLLDSFNKFVKVFE